MNRDEKKTILLVEDESSSVVIISTLMKKFGYELLVVHTGEDAVDLAAADRRIDLILMDIHLGIGMDGTSAAKHILGLRDIPIIFLSSHSDRETVEKVRGITRYGYVMKTSDEYVLRSSIEMAFELFEARCRLDEELAERRRAEEAWRESEQQYRGLVENSPDAIAIYSNGNLLFVNNECARLIGSATTEELIGRPVIQFVHPESRTRVAQRMYEVAVNGLPLPREREKFMRMDGTPIDVEVKAIPTTYNQKPAIQIIVRDIGERISAEAALRESETRYSTIFDQSPIALQFYGPDGVLLKVNAKCLDIFGVIDADEIKGWNIYLDPNVTPEQKERLRKGEEIQYITNFDFELITKAGLYRTTKSGLRIFDVLISPLGIGFIAQIQDITEHVRDRESLQRIEARLRQSEKMEAIGQLAGGIAHDFNNVLGGIIGYTDMSLTYADKGGVLENNLLKVLKASERAKHLVKQILAFSRQGNPQKSIISVQPVVEEALDLLKSSIPSSVVIEADLQRGTNPVLMDSTQIHQALLNLATNAVHAMQRKGTLTVRLYAEHLDHKDYGQSGELTPGEYTIIEVGDDGTGMDSTTLSRVFEPFFTTKAVGEGTGMGLSVVLGIIQSHGGDIQIESEVGVGTTVKIYLPVSEAAAPESSHQHSQELLFGTETILFVDDELMLVEMVDHMLTSLGYTVKGMSNGMDALEYFKAHSAEIDVLITDQTMPQMSGSELSKAVLRIREDLPIILCTGFSNEVDRELSMSLGIGKFIMKPYRSLEISTAIRELIDSRSE
jgi:PAS domain S-box-containing protein